MLPLWKHGDEQKFLSWYVIRKRFTNEEVVLIESLGIKEAKEVKHNNWIKAELFNKNPYDKSFFCLVYIRYIDNFIFGFTGTKAETDVIEKKFVEHLVVSYF